MLRHKCSLISLKFLDSNLCKVLSIDKWALTITDACNFLSFSGCSWCLSDFSDKKPFCLSTSNLAQAAASENWLVSMPLLIFVGSNETTQGWGQFQLQQQPLLELSPDRAANKPIALSCSTTIGVIFLLATSYTVRKPGYTADGNQITLATCTVLLPLFQ